MGRDRASSARDGRRSRDEMGPVRSTRSTRTQRADSTVRPKSARNGLSPRNVNSTTLQAAFDAGSTTLAAGGSALAWRGGGHGDGSCYSTPIGTYAPLDVRSGLSPRIRGEPPLEKSSSTPALLAERKAIDHHRTMDPQLRPHEERVGGCAPDPAVFTESYMWRAREVGPEKQPYVQGSKITRSIPGYSGFVPAKYSESVYGMAHGRLNSVAANLQNLMDDEEGAAEFKFSKCVVPGYSGHIPRRRDDVIAKTHGDGIIEADALWQSRRENQPPPAKPKKHMAAGVMSHGWYGNAPHYTLAFEVPTDRSVLAKKIHDPATSYAKKDAAKEKEKVKVRKELTYDNANIARLSRHPN